MSERCPALTIGACEYGPAVRHDRCVHCGMAADVVAEHTASLRPTPRALTAPVRKGATIAEPQPHQVSLPTFKAMCEVLDENDKRITDLIGQNERQSVRISELERQVAGRSVRLHPSQIQPDEDCPGLYLRCANAAQRRAIIDLLSAATDEPHARDPIGPADGIHDRVERVIGDIAAGRVVAPARKALRDAVDKADAPLTGRAKSDAGIGRAIRYGGMVAP